MYFNSFISNIVSEYVRGVCILFSTSVAYKVLRSCKDHRGNVLILDLEFEGKRFKLINIYSPNEDSPSFFSKVQKK